jgi:hypothetical protein
MRNWMKQFGASVSLVFTLGVSSTALAYPPQCMDVCTCQSSCAAPCYYGTKRFSCADEICADQCRVGSTQATLTPEQQKSQEQQDASQNVCTEQEPQSASSES